MKIHTPLLATVFAVATALTADAALITWDAPQNTTGDTDVSLTGTFVAAASFGGLTPTTTVNGVTFTGLQGFTPANADFTLSGVANLFTYIGGGAPFSSLSAPYQDLLKSTTFISGNLALNLLTPGATYQLQLWSQLSASGPGSLTATTGASSVKLSANTIVSPPGLGQYVLGSFVADAATQAITLSGFLAGVQLRQTAAPAAPAAVPEPGTALAGVMLAGLLGLRRRRAAAPAQG